MKVKFLKDHIQGNAGEEKYLPYEQAKYLIGVRVAEGIIESKKEEKIIESEKNEAINVPKKRGRKPKEK